MADLYKIGVKELNGDIISSPDSTSLMAKIDISPYYMSLQMYD